MARLVSRYLMMSIMSDIIIIVTMSHLRMRTQTPTMVYASRVPMLIMSTS